jgi:hypothetical protein
VKVDSVAPTKNHVAGVVKNRLLKELKDHTGETDSENKDEEEEEVDT